jgi:hypothetical protein
MSIHLSFGTYCNSQMNMATQLEQWSKNEVCVIILFLDARNVTAAEVYCQLKEVQGGVMS